MSRARHEPTRVGSIWMFAGLRLRIAFRLARSDNDRPSPSKPGNNACGATFIARSCWRTTSLSRASMMILRETILLGCCCSTAEQAVSIGPSCDSRMLVPTLK